MKYVVKIITEDYDTCDGSCPFLNQNDCMLFNRGLQNTKLEPGYVWPDGTTITKQRLWQCKTFDE